MNLKKTFLVLLLVIGCESHCPWNWCLPSEDHQWIHREGAEYYEPYIATLSVWRDQGLPEPNVRRVAMLLVDGATCGGGSNGCAVEINRPRSTIEVNNAIDDETTERLIIHELLHVFGGQSDVGSDSDHSNPEVWRPSLGSVEAITTCILQEALCEEP